ncbi:hypothetical protein [Cryobacterium sp. HLT2-28]|nr:hypothetical protein [Cryobacterium sp. HLT2-28]
MITPSGYAEPARPASAERWKGSSTFGPEKTVNPHDDGERRPDES